MLWPSRAPSLLPAALGAVLLIGLGTVAMALTASPLASHEPQTAVAHNIDTGDSGLVLASAEELAGRQADHPSYRGSRDSAQPAPSSPTATSPSPTAQTPTPPPSPQTAAASAQNSSGQTLRVGIQAGHWKTAELPQELSSLRGSTGAQGNGWKEVDVNLDIARRVAVLLQQAGIQADLIPSTVPSHYKADAFVALHGDGNANTSASGYKLARSSSSSIPTRDDSLLNALGAAYQTATGLRNNTQSITQAMLRYYAFNQRLEHSVDPATPAVILEMGFLTNSGDRATLTSEPDRVAAGIAKGLLKFLGKS